MYHAAPGLAEAIISWLSHWRLQRQFHGFPGLSEEAGDALHHQDVIGWDNFCFGLVSHSLCTLQDHHLKASSWKLSGVSWFSKVIRKLWDLQHSLWEHRNKFVHGSESSVHAYELEAVNQSLYYEFMIGRDGLSEQFSSLFQGSVDSLLGKDNISKLQWLHSV